MTTITRRSLMLGAMARAGARGFYLGVESGSQRMLDLMRKDITVDQIRDAFRWCRDAGIKTIASTIIAVPGETEEDLRQTNELLEEIKPTLVWRNVFTGIPYSDLYHAAVTERSYEYIDDRGILYLQGHNERVTHYYHDQWNACIPDKEENKDWTNKPKISVLMAVHNGERFLAQAMESIYRQTCQDFDDGKSNGHRNQQFVRHEAPPGECVGEGARIYELCTPGPYESTAEKHPSCTIEPGRAEE